MLKQWRTEGLRRRPGHVDVVSPQSRRPVFVTLPPALLLEGLL